MRSNNIQKLPPMRTSEDVVNRIQHDECIDKNLVIVGYLDRFLGIIEKKFTAFVWCKVEMAAYLDLAIPKHRIEYFKYHGEVVWSKKDRIDKVFGSSKSGNETILEVIERHAAAIEEEKRIASEQTVELDPTEKNRREPLRPTHFICIPFTNSSIKRNAQSIQKEVCNKASKLGMNVHELEVEGCILLSALHITLVMIHCPTLESISHARSVFESFGDLLNLYVPRHLLLTLHGVASFDERVIYSPPVEIGRLTKLVSEMKLRLKQGGVRLVGNHDPYSPHMTLVKLNRKLSKSLNYDGSIGKLPRGLFESNENRILGQQSCESIQFCELYSPKDPHTGFYRCLSSLANIPSAPPKCIPDTITSSELLFQLFPSQFSEKTCDDKSLLPKSLEGNCFVILMRGLPGHGKTSFAQKIISAWNELSPNSFYISADDFMVGSQGEYHFDPSLLSNSHQKCQEKFRDVLDSHRLRLNEEEVQSSTFIIVDNTNTVPEEYFCYQSLARQYGAKVAVLEVDISFMHEVNGNYPILSWEKALHVSSIFGKHSVPRNTLQRMWSRWIPDANAVSIIRLHSENQISYTNTFNMSLISAISNITCQYIGVIIDEESRQRLLKSYPPIYSCVRAHHVTLCHANETNQMMPHFSLGSLCEITVYAEIKDSQCQGVVIEVATIGSTTDSSYQGHITLSHNPSVTPKYTKQLLENRLSNEKVEYNLRAECDPLVLRGVVSACLLKDKHVDYCSHAVDLWNLSQESLHVHETPSLPIRLPSRFQFESIPKDVQTVYIFDLDDTLLHTPSIEEYKALTGTSWKKPKSFNGGWFCHPDSLDLRFEYPVCRGLLDLLDRVGEIDSAIIVLTGRPLQLQSEIVNLLGSRNLLDCVSGIFCKPTVRENTSDFKAEFLLDLCRQRDKIKRIEVWDDKNENLLSMEDVVLKENFINLTFLTHFVPPYEDDLSSSDAVIQWSELNNAVLSQRQLTSRTQAIGHIQTCWQDILHQLSGSTLSSPNGSDLTHIFGSYVYERTSDIDMMIILPKDILGSVANNCQWMKELETKLLNTGKLLGFEVLSYRGTTGTVPKMSLKFFFRDLPTCDVDLIGLLCDSTDMLNSSIPLAVALNWTVEELDMHYQLASSQLTSGDYHVLYGLSVRNNCVARIMKSGLTLRQFGCLLGAARRLMDRAFAMGTIRCGMRPYLLTLTLAEVISREDIGSSLSSLLLSWITWHLSDSLDGVGSLKTIYHGGVVADTHLHRIIKTFKMVHSSLMTQSSLQISLYQNLNILSLPNQNDFQSVSIKIISPSLQPLSKAELYSSANVLYGILSKYFGRMIRDGHDIISCPSIHSTITSISEQENHEEIKIEIALFGLSRHSSDVFQYLFGSICKDFEMVHKARKLQLEIVG